MRTIIAAINLLITAGFGAIRINRISKIDLPVLDKVVKVRDELAKILGKLEVLATTTEPEWDDILASTLSGMLEVVAQNIIDQLEEERT
jgi:hypothetical protein